MARRYDFKSLGADGASEIIKIAKSKDLVSIMEFALLAGFHHSTVRSYIKKDLIPTVRVGRNFKIPRVEAMHIISSGMLAGKPAKDYTPKVHDVEQVDSPSNETVSRSQELPRRAFERAEDPIPEELEGIPYNPNN